MSKSPGIIRNALAALLFMACLTGTAMAEESWERHHPRRAEVNDRLAHQNARIREEVKEGDLTKAQAAALHKEHREIRHEERDMARQNHGHITKLEQKTLNQQENAISKQIGK